MSFAGSIGAEVVIELTADDRASAKISSSTDVINQKFRAMKNEQRAVVRQFELSNRVFVQTARVIQAVGRIAQQGVAIWQAYEIGQIRIANANKAVRDAQNELRKAILEGDPEEITKRTQDLTDAEDEAARASRDAAIGMGLIIFQVAGLVGGIGKIIPQLQRMNGVFRSLKTNIKGTTTELDKFKISSTNAPTKTSGLPSEEKTPIGTKAPPSVKGGSKGGGSKGGIKGGGVGGKLFGGASLAFIPILEDILTSSDPLERLKQWIGLSDQKDLKEFNLGGVTFKSDPNVTNPPLDITITMGTQSKTIHLEEGSYGVE